MLMCLTAYNGIPIPATAPFELKPSGNKGWGAFATRRIAQGASILREDPLFIIRKPCLEITDLDVVRAVQLLPMSKKLVYGLLRDNGGAPFISANRAFAENSFNMGAEDSHGVQADGPRGFFIIHSRFNHTCSRPNTWFPSARHDRQFIESFATRDILPGEELNFSYEGASFLFMTRQERHSRLAFQCRCDHCEADASVRQLSNLRRRLARGVYFLQHGMDSNGENQQFIIDVSMRLDAVNRRFPVSCQLIFQILTAYLAEQEGLLDGNLHQQLTRSIGWTSKLFATKKNTTIIRRLSEQKTWLGMFLAAFQLWGERDLVDQEFLDYLRLASGR